MNENDLSKIIIDGSIKMHKVLGPGLLESVYEKVLAFELEKQGLAVQRQVSIPITYENIIFDEEYRADIIVNNLVIIEIKSINEINQIHYKQLLSYLKLSGKKLGMLINFNTKLLKFGIKRIINGIIE